MFVLTAKKTDDIEYRRYMRQRIKACNGYCPDSFAHTPDMKCPCEAFREQKEPGYCDLGYWLKQLVEVEDKVEDEKEGGV